MNLNEMSSLFSIDNVNKAGAMFDKVKLLKFNSYYIRNRDSNWILDKMDIPGDFLLSINKDKLELIANIATERAVMSSDLTGAMDYIYKTPNIREDFKLKNVEDFTRVMGVFISEDFMCNFEEREWTSSHIKYEIEQISANMGIKVGKIMPMLREAICGGESGPQLQDVMYIIGREETKNRIKNLIKKIEEVV
jgi:glutamyl-tRNA synthetase